MADPNTDPPATPPAAPPPTDVAKVAPNPLYYLAIDGTDAIDSVAYGELLETQLGWMNLATDLLKPADNDPTRLNDPSHPFLPICLFDASGKKRKIAVVCPGGRNGEGKDAFWKDIDPDPKDWEDSVQDFTTVGRNTALEDSAIYMRSLILHPSVDIGQGDTGPEAHLYEEDIPMYRTVLRSFPADMLIVSSHGWLGGFMRGNWSDDWPDAQPTEAQGSNGPRHTYFLVGEAAVKGMHFYGPQWIVLAQCSTINSATWPLWARVLHGSDPPVRGILAYEEVSPGPEGSVDIARSFVQHLKTDTILNSWKKANAGQKWAAIVHKDAVNDHIKDWRSFPQITDTETTATSGSYLGFLSIASGSQEIHDVPPPFGLHLCRVRKDQIFFPDQPLPPASSLNVLEVTPDTLDQAQARLRGDSWYRITVEAPPGRTLVSIAMSWVHIRVTYNVQFTAKQLFQSVNIAPEQDSLATAQFQSAHSRVIMVQAQAGQTPDSLTFLLHSQPADALENTGLDFSHSYIWPHIDLTLDQGTLSYDYKIIGLLY